MEKVELAPKQNKRCLRFQFLQKVGEISIVHNIMLGILARYTVIKVNGYFWTKIISHKILNKYFYLKSDSVTNKFDFCLGNTSRYKRGCRIWWRCSPKECKNRRIHSSDNQGWQSNKQNRFHCLWRIYEGWKYRN